MIFPVLLFMDFIVASFKVLWKKRRLAYGAPSLIQEVIFFVVIRLWSQSLVLRLLRRSMIVVQQAKDPCKAK